MSNFLSFMLHSSPSLSTYSHHSQGSPTSRATRAAHNDRMFICRVGEVNEGGKAGQEKGPYGKQTKSLVKCAGHISVVKLLFKGKPHTA